MPKHELYKSIMCNCRKICKSNKMIIRYFEHLQHQLSTVETRKHIMNINKKLEPDLIDNQAEKSSEPITMVSKL